MDPPVAIACIDEGERGRVRLQRTRYVFPPVQCVATVDEDCPALLRRLCHALDLQTFLTSLLARRNGAAQDPYAWERGSNYGDVVAGNCMYFRSALFCADRNCFNPVLAAVGQTSMQPWLWDANSGHALLKLKSQSTPIVQIVASSSPSGTLLGVLGQRDLDLYQF